MVDICVSFKPYLAVHFEVKVVYGTGTLSTGNVYRTPVRTKQMLTKTTEEISIKCDSKYNKKLIKVTVSVRYGT
jgi:hypothetical protein